MVNKNEITPDSRWDAQYKNWFSTAQEIDIEKLLRADAPEYNFNEILPELLALFISLQHTNFFCHRYCDFVVMLSLWHYCTISTVDIFVRR